MTTLTAKTWLATLLGGAFFLQPLAGMAEFHATLTATNNNVGRWFSKSNHDFALLGNIDYEHSSGFYVGSSASNVNFNADKPEDNAAHIEAIPYFGWNFKLNDTLRIDTEWKRYLYDGTVFNHNANYNEFYLFLHYKDMLSGRVSFAENYYGLGDYAIDYELTGRYSLIDTVELSASFGYSQTKAVLGSDYPYWNAGLTYYYKFISLDFRYMDATETSIDEVSAKVQHDRYDPPLIGATFVFSVSVGY